MEPLWWAKGIASGSRSNSCKCWMHMAPKVIHPANLRPTMEDHIRRGWLPWPCSLKRSLSRKCKRQNSRCCCIPNIPKSYQTAKSSSWPLSCRAFWATLQPLKQAFLLPSDISCRKKKIKKLEEELAIGYASFSESNEAQLFRAKGFKSKGASLRLDIMDLVYGMIYQNFRCVYFATTGWMNPSTSIA